MIKPSLKTTTSASNAKEFSDLSEAQALCHRLMQDDPLSVAQNRKLASKATQRIERGTVPRDSNPDHGINQPLSSSGSHPRRMLETPAKPAIRPAPNWDWNAAIKAAEKHRSRPIQSVNGSILAQRWIVASLTMLIGVCWLQTFCWGRSQTDSLDRQPICGSVEGASGRSGRLTLVPLKGTNGPVVFTLIRGGSYQFDRASGPVPGHYEAKILLESSGLTARDLKLPTGSVEPFINPQPQGFEVERSVAVVVSSGATQLAINVSGLQPRLQ